MASIAHAAPSIDMSGVTSVMQTVETACLLIGAIIVLISLVFSVFSFAGGNIMRGVTGVAGVLFGGLVIGLGPTWISSLTGQAVN
jgi:nucleoside recognition membrane protein YjiH